VSGLSERSLPFSCVWAEIALAVVALFSPGFEGKADLTGRGEGTESLAGTFFAATT